MSHPFRSLANTRARVDGVVKQWTEAEHVHIARELLTEHAAAREAAMRAANQVCATCTGAGVVASTVMAGHTVTCFACEGTGKPGEKAAIAIPAMTPQDDERIWKIGRLLEGPHRVAVLAVVREFFPDLYAEKDGPAS